MSPEITKQYLDLVALMCRYDVDRQGVDVVSVPLMRRILKRLIVRGTFIPCALCGQMITHAKDLSFDHIVPRSCGGSDLLHNMQPAHRKCNELKGNNVTPDDIAESCANSDDSVKEIEARKRRLKEADKKYRNAKWLKPWQITDFDNER